MAEAFHDKLRRIRFDRKKSQLEVSEYLGVDKTSYGRYENGTVEIRFEQVAQLAEFYNLSLDELYHYGEHAQAIKEPKPTYEVKWSVPITVSLDGTDQTLEKWIKRLTAINAAI